MFVPVFSLSIVWLLLFYCKIIPVLHVFRGIHAIGRQKEKKPCRVNKKIGANMQLNLKIRVIFANGPIIKYSLHTRKECRFGQRYGLQSLTLTFYFYKNIYHKIVYLYFNESVFQEKSIHMVFVFWNSTISKLSKTTFFRVWSTEPHI